MANPNPHPVQLANSLPDIMSQAMMNPHLAQNAANPPRPDIWEVPQLTDERNYFMPPPGRKRYVPATLSDALDSAVDVAQQSRVIGFLRSIVQFGNVNDTWWADQVLGEGGYGTVALWIKMNNAGVINDQLVVKLQEEAQTDRNGVPVSVFTNGAQAPYNWNWNKYNQPDFMFRGVLREAAITKQMNDYNCENIIHLRGYKWLTTRNPGGYTDDGVAPQSRVTKSGRRRRPTPGSNVQRLHRPPIKYNTGRFRFLCYYEYAPHQTLQHLINRYRAWDQHLPEAFLWHVFDSLAAAMQLLSKGPLQKLSSEDRTVNTVQRWPCGTFVLHGDVKPNNVLLGYPQWRDNRTNINGGSAVLGYPVVKLADFGLADITGPWDPLNVGDHEFLHTKGYKAPEMKFYSLDWPTPLNHAAQRTNTTARDDEIANPGSFSYDDSTNIWQIAKTMYDLMTLSRPLDVEYQVYGDYGELATQTNYESHNYQHHFLHRDRWKTEWKYRLASLAEYTINVPHNTYSDELVGLIRDCMQPNMTLRPSIGEVRRRTQAGLARQEHLISGSSACRPRKTPIRRGKSRTAPDLTLDPNAPHVYQDHTINNMPQGTMHHQVDHAVLPLPPGSSTYPPDPTQLSYDIRQLNSKFDKPHSWPELQPPLAKFQNDHHLMTAAGGPGATGWQLPITGQGIRNTHTLQNGRIWFGP